MQTEYDFFSPKVTCVCMHVSAFKLFMAQRKKRVSFKFFVARKFFFVNKKKRVP